MHWLVNPDLTDQEVDLWPQVCGILSYFEDEWPERGGHQQLRRFLARVVWGDPLIRLDCVLEDRTVIACALSTLEIEGPHKWIFCQVAYHSNDVESYAKRYVEDLKRWGRDVGATHVLWSSKRSARAMARAFGTQPGGSTVHRIPIDTREVSI